MSLACLLKIYTVLGIKIIIQTYKCIFFLNLLKHLHASKHIELWLFLTPKMIHSAEMAVVISTNDEDNITLYCTFLENREKSWKFIRRVLEMVKTLCHICKASEIGRNLFFLP